MNHVRSFSDADEHNFAFAAAAADKANGCVIFERVQIRDNIHIYVDRITVRACYPFPMCHFDLPDPAS